MLMRIVGIVFPVFVIVLIGFYYGRRFRPDMSAANRLNMLIFLPALIFGALAGKSFAVTDHMAIALGAALVVVGSGLLAWPVARALGYSPRTFLPPVMFNNCGNMGVPLALLTFGDQALGAAVVMLIVSVFLQFSVGMWITSGRMSFSMLWREPLLWAAILGTLISVSGFTLWPPLTMSIKLLGDVSIGLMIFALGVRLSMSKLGAWNIGIAGGIATPVTGLLVAWAFAEAAHLSPLNRDMLLLFGAMPPAISNFIFAEQYGQEPDKTASMVLIGNAMAIFFIPLALALQL